MAKSAGFTIVPQDKTPTESIQVKVKRPIQVAFKKWCEEGLKSDQGYVMEQILTQAIPVDYLNAAEQAEKGGEAQPSKPKPRKDKASSAAV